MPNDEVEGAERNEVPANGWLKPGAEMCNCQHHARIWEETLNGRFSPSKHAPSCEDYEQKRYVRLFDPETGMGFIDTPENQYLFMSSGDEIVHNLHQEDVFLTEDQFESIPEFEGF